MLSNISHERHELENQCKKDNKGQYDALEIDYTHKVKSVINAMKQNKIKLTTLPLGLALVYNYCIGFIL